MSAVDMEEDGRAMREERRDVHDGKEPSADGEEASLTAICRANSCQSARL